MSIYCGREFSAQEIQAIRHLIEQQPGLRRAALSRKLCELFGWVQPNGQLKDMTCRVALLRMQADGLITLPASRMSRPRSRAHFPPTPATDAQTALVQPVHELAELTLRRPADTTASRLWNEYIARYHYLGYTPLSGSQLRYNVFAGDRLVALLSFGASAWKLAARESFIGWHEPQRRCNLQLVVNNARFLILPVLISVAAGIGSSTRWYRTIFLEEIGKDYVRTARAKGLSELAVLFRHVLKNAMIPILTGVVVVIPLLFMGSLLVESFFGIPGLGSYTIDAINAQDFAVVRAMVFIGSVLYIVGLILTDISYTVVDPRIRFE